LDLKRAVGSQGETEELQPETPEGPRQLTAYPGSQSRIYYQNLRKLDDPARFAPWFYRIAHNEAFSLFRKRRPEGETEELQPETLAGSATLGGNAVFPVEWTLAVSGALRKLSADQTGNRTIP
jgi:hypothetical protein